MDSDDMIAELVIEHGDRLLRLAFQLTHDRASAEDIVQEALMTMYRSWRRRRPEIENLPAYARRAVVNEFLRRRRLRSASDVVTSELPERATANFDNGVVDREALWSELGRLPARQRTVLVLRYYEDLAYARIAELMACPEATVRSLAARGLTRLRAAASLPEAGA